MVGDSSKLFRFIFGESPWDFSHLILKANWFDQSKPVDLELWKARSLLAMLKYFAA